uniref:Endoplasmic reticulum transmembrane protein n=1 Tax=Stegastes partitus TaxID=144197 RepID=A0A3B5AP38_9TELE
MSLQWTAVATFLYVEVFFVLLLCIPFISPKRSVWNKIFKSRIVQTIALYGNTSFMVAMAILVFLLIDAFREVRKYSVTEKVDLTNNPTAIEHIHMKLFRAQRNEYIAGFHLLPRFHHVLWQLVTQLYKRTAHMMVVPEGEKKGPGVQEENKTLKQEVKTLKEELDTTKKGNGSRTSEVKEAQQEVKPLQKSDSDVRAMKKQAENLTVEYDRLLDEHSKLLVRRSDDRTDQP